jgi:hypothetical protein
MKILNFNYIIAFFVVFSMAICSITAQSNLNFCIKGGTFAGKMSINSSLKVVDNGRAAFDTGTGSIAMAFSSPISKKFRLGAEMGMNTLTEFFDKKITFSDNTTSSYLGYYRINQSFVALVPEYRIFNWLYANAGAGLYFDNFSSFTNGYLRTSGGTSVDLTGQSAKRERSLGAFIGVGACPNITKELALLAEVKYLSCSPSSDSGGNLGVGFNVININIGLMYKPRQ